MNAEQLARLGWQPFLQLQLSLAEQGSVEPVRVVGQHRSNIEVCGASGQLSLAVPSAMAKEDPLVVGDWLLLDDKRSILRRLERSSCFRRKAPGSQVAEQLLAANVDTAFIVCSLNDDFNLNRIERFLSLVNEAGAKPVVVLSKRDLCATADELLTEVQALDSLMTVVAINCLDPDSVTALQPWCAAGQTVVMLGSSGSGKSTLSNTLLGAQRQATGAVREDDSKGRHTTTSRALLSMPAGAMLLDTPGIRELQLTACEAGVAATFADIEALSRRCKFADCQHESEPGCAVLAAIEGGEIDQRRLGNYRKLLNEQAHNAASLAQRRARDRALSAHYSRSQREGKRSKRGED